MEVNDGLTKTWDRRWAGSEEKERLTLLGKAMFRAKKKALLSLVSEMDPGSVIEVGCGLGHTLEVYVRAGLRARGIDISPSAVAVCRQKGLPAELIPVEAEKGAYDLVSSDGMLEHFLNFEPMAAELTRISRRHVLLIQPNHGSFSGKTLVYFSELLRGHENVFEYNYRIADFIDAFERLGFGLRKNRPVFGDVFRILLFEKKTDDRSPSAGGIRPGPEEKEK